MIKLRLIFLGLYCLVLGCIHADTWSPAMPIPNSPPVQNDVFVLFDPALKKSLATWIDKTSGHPTFAFFDGVSWGIPGTISTKSRALHSVGSNVYTALNGKPGQYVAAWPDSDDGTPMYAIYTGSNWTTAKRIDDVAAEGDVFISFNPISKNILATWQSNLHIPFYSRFMGSSWTKAMPISPSADAFRTVFNCFYPKTNHFIATWGNFSSETQYSLFNGTSWSTPTTITDLDDSDSNIFCSLYPPTGQILATWVNSANIILYSFFNGSNWSSPLSISFPDMPFGDVISSYVGGNRILATWQDKNTSEPFYAIYEGTNWGPATAIDISAQVTSDHTVYTSFNPFTRVALAAWGSMLGNDDATYSTISLHTSTPIPPLPPPLSDGLRGVQEMNNFSIVSERFNALSWIKTPGVVTYFLYRDGVLIATLDGDKDSYQDHNQPKSVRTYTLVALNDQGVTFSATVSVGGK